MSDMKYIIEYCDEMTNIEMKEEIESNISYIAKMLTKTDGKRLTKTQIEEMEEENEFEQGDLSAGKGHTILSWKFGSNKDVQTIIKIYKLDLSEIIWHFQSSLEFNEKLKESELEIQNESYEIQTAKVRAFGKMHIGESHYSFIIQDFILGSRLPNHLIGTNASISKVLKEILGLIRTYNFVIDPSPSNWIVQKMINYSIVYVDLLFNKNNLIKTEVEDIIQNISKDFKLIEK